MRLSRILLAATLVVASAGTRTAFAQAKDAALDKFVADYIAAFNQGDAKAVAPCTRRARFASCRGCRRTSTCPRASTQWPTWARHSR